MNRTRQALGLLGLAATAVIGWAWLITLTWHVPYTRGLYCAIGTAATDGCNAIPATTAGEMVHIGAMLTTIPLLAAVFTLLAGSHLLKRFDKRLAEHHAKTEQAIKDHVEQRLKHHLGK